MKASTKIRGLAFAGAAFLAPSAASAAAPPPCMPAVVAPATSAIPVNLPGGTIRILDRETLIQAKIAMGRPHDLITVDQLRRIPSASELNGNAE